MWGGPNRAQQPPQNTVWTTEEKLTNLDVLRDGNSASLMAPKENSSPQVQGLSGLWFSTLPAPTSLRNFLKFKTYTKTLKISKTQFSLFC